MRPAPSDTVPAMLTPGEAVLNKEAAELVGRDKIKQINKMGMHMRKAQGYADGDPNVQPKPVAQPTAQPQTFNRPVDVNAPQRQREGVVQSAGGSFGFRQMDNGDVVKFDSQGNQMKTLGNIGSTSNALYKPLGGDYASPGMTKPAETSLSTTTPAAAESSTAQPAVYNPWRPQATPNRAPFQPQIDLLGEYKSAVGLANGTEMVQGYVNGTSLADNPVLQEVKQRMVYPDAFQPGTPNQVHGWDVNVDPRPSVQPQGSIAPGRGMRPVSPVSYNAPEWPTTAGSQPSAAYTAAANRAGVPPTPPPNAGVGMNRPVPMNKSLVPAGETESFGRPASNIADAPAKPAVDKWTGEPINTSGSQGVLSKAKNVIKNIAADPITLAQIADTYNTYQLGNNIASGDRSSMVDTIGLGIRGVAHLGSHLPDVVNAMTPAQQPVAQGMKVATPVVHAADLPSQQLAALTPVSETRPTQQVAQTPQPQPVASAPQAEEQLTGNRVIPAGMRLTSYGAVTPINNPLAYEAERRMAERVQAAQMAPINALIEQAMNPSADDGTFTGMGRAKRQARGARAALSELTGMQKAQTSAASNAADRAANREVTMRGQDITAANAAESNRRQLIGDLISRDLGMQRLNVDTDRIKAIRERLAQEQAMADAEQERQMLEGLAAQKAFKAGTEPVLPFSSRSPEDEAIAESLLYTKNPTQYITARAK